MLVSCMTHIHESCSFTMNQVTSCFAELHCGSILSHCRNFSCRSGGSSQSDRVSGKYVNAKKEAKAQIWPNKLKQTCEMCLCWFSLLLTGMTLTSLPSRCLFILRVQTQTFFIYILSNSKIDATTLRMVPLVSSLREDWLKGWREI